MRSCFFASLAFVSGCLYDVPPLASDEGGVSDGGTGFTESGAPCSCVPTPPAGWSIVSYVQDSRPNCPPEYGFPVDGVSDPTAPPASCSCTCDPTPVGTPSCNNNGHTFSVTMGNATCMAGSMDNIQFPTNTCTNAMMTFTGAVTNISAGVNNNNVQGGCGAPVVNESLPPASQKNDRTCAMQSAGSCGSGTVCAPTPTGGYQLCVSKSGGPNDNMPEDCPSGWPNRHISGATVQDGRRCGTFIGPCTCNFDGVCTTTLSIYGSQNCANPLIATVVANSTCQATAMTGQNIVRSGKYTSMVTGGSQCKVDPSYKANGGVSIKRPQIAVCCR